MTSGASTEPCRGRRIPGPARCRQGQRTLSVGSTAFGRLTRAPAVCTLYSARCEVNSYIRLGRPRSPNSGLLGRRLRREAAVGGRPCSRSTSSSSASDSALRRSAGHSSCIAETGPTVLQVQCLEVVDTPIVVQRQVRSAEVCRQGCGAEA